MGLVTRADLVRAFARPDDVIQREIREDVLQRTLWLSDPAAIEVEVSGGKVRLQGAADSECDAELIGTFAAKVPGVVDVDSFLTSLLGATETMLVWLAPPVPTMNSRIPRVVYSVPVGVCGAKRS